MKSEFYRGEPSTEIWNPDREFNTSDACILKKDKGKDFIILNLTDIHFSDIGERVSMIPGTAAKIGTLVDKLHPDLITITGDIVCGDKTLNSIKKLTELMESFGIPWAPVFGNHDDEGECDLNRLADEMLLGEHCVFKKNDPEMGVGNYIICIAEDGENGVRRMVEAIFMTDSHHSQPNAKQLKWFEWAAAGINRLSGSTAEISMMMHVPFPEFQLAYDGRNGVNGVTDFCGECHEEICCERDREGKPFSRGFFDSVKKSGTTRHILCGHDHINDFSAVYEGIRLTYMLKIGPASGYIEKFDGGTAIRVGNNGISRITHKTVRGDSTEDVLDVVTGR